MAFLTYRGCKNFHRFRYLQIGMSIFDLTIKTRSVVIVRRGKLYATGILCITDGNGIIAICSYTRTVVIDCHKEFSNRLMQGNAL